MREDELAGKIHHKLVSFTSKQSRLLKDIHESKAKKKAEAKKWRLIATGLEFYELKFVGR